jgi:hypothetical protein
MHGHGVYRYINGNLYDGNWIDCKKDGHGVYL